MTTSPRSSSPHSSPRDAADTIPPSDAATPPPNTILSANLAGLRERARLARSRTLPPLSPLTYYRRNVWRTLPVGGAIVISVFLIAAIVTLLNSVDASITSNYGFVRRFSVVAPQLERDVPPRTAALVTKNPHIGRVILAVPYVITISTVFGQMPVPVYGIDPKDMPELVRVCGGKLAAGGRFPNAGDAEIVLTRAWANNLHAKIGKKIKFKDDRIATVTEEQTLVGIIDGGENIALTSKDYLLLTLPDPVLRTSLLLIPRTPQELPQVDARANDVVDHPQKYGLAKRETQLVKVYTFAKGIKELRNSLKFLYDFLAIADILVIGAVALLSGFLANIYFEGRLGEFGLLSAFGFRRERLARRLVIESGALVALAWAVGLALTWSLFRGLDYFYMKPRGLVLAELDTLALKYTLPTPILVGVASLGTVLLRLYRLDPINIMERR